MTSYEYIGNDNNIDNNYDDNDNDNHDDDDGDYNKNDDNSGDDDDDDDDYYDYIDKIYTQSSHNNFPGLEIHNTQ